MGRRISLAHTRAIIDAIHRGTIIDAPVEEDDIFGLSIPMVVPGVPVNILHPEATWSDRAAYRQTAQKLAGLFQQNFRQYASAASEAIRNAGPRKPLAASA